MSWRDLLTRNLMSGSSAKTTRDPEPFLVRQDQDGNLAAATMAGSESDSPSTVIVFPNLGIRASVTG